MNNSIKADIIFFFGFLLVLANVFIWQFIFSLDGNLKVVFFDIGQGDSAFIETAQGHQILIDGGPGEKVLTKLGKAMPFWDRTIDLVVLSHPEYDHLSGLVKVLERYQVKNVLWTGIERNSKIFDEWQTALNKEKALIVIAKNGETIKAGLVGLYVLHPLDSLEGQFLEKDSNDTAVVLQVSYGQNKFLFTGDISSKVEKDLISQNPCPGPCSLESDVLKVAHHGSKYSSSLEFLAAVAPRVAVISCGANNNYGHPQGAVLSNLQEFGITIRRTDQLGDIKVVSDGKNLIY